MLRDKPPPQNQPLTANCPKKTQTTCLYMSFGLSSKFSLLTHVYVYLPTISGHYHDVAVPHPPTSPYTTTTQHHHHALTTLPPAAHITHRFFILVMFFLLCLYIIFYMLLYYVLHVSTRCFLCFHIIFLMFLYVFCVSILCF